MAARLSRQDFLIKDLVISIPGGSRGGTWMPADDEDLPSPISPVAGVLNKLDLIDAVRGAIVKAVKADELDDVARAFDGGALDGNAVIRSAIHEIGVAVVASAAFAGIRGSVALPDPNCGGTSLETIPPTLTPVVHKAWEIHRVAELPRLRTQLAETVRYVDHAAEVMAPTSDEVDELRGHLREALGSLDR